MKELKDALLSLTAERQNFLSFVEGSRDSQSDPVFNPQTTFSINKIFVSGLLAKEPRPHVSWTIVVGCHSISAGTFP